MITKVNKIKLGLFIFLVNYLVSVVSFAEEINPKRAKYNYQMFCQGCHTPDGSGGKDVPKFKGFVGSFLNTQQGREYLIQVPGSANSTLSDRDLAEVLNWIILEFGSRSIPNDWQKYTKSEINRYRQEPLFEVFNYRKNIISGLQKHIIR